MVWGLAAVPRCVKCWFSGLSIHEHFVKSLNIFNLIFTACWGVKCQNCSLDIKSTQLGSCHLINCFFIVYLVVVCPHTKKALIPVNNQNIRKSRCENRNEWHVSSKSIHVTFLISKPTPMWFGRNLSGWEPCLILIKTLLIKTACLVAIEGWNKLIEPKFFEVQVNGMPVLVRGYLMVVYLRQL